MSENKEIKSDSQYIVHQFDEMYTEAYYLWNSFFPEAERDLRFYLGDQWSEQEKRDLFQEGRNTFVFNRLRRNINLVTGYQRKNRLSSVVVPFEDKDQLVADQMTQILLHVMNGADGYRKISDCFAGSLKTGWNLCSLWMDYRNDPVNGDIRMSREPYNAFILDPYFTERDLSDCGYILRRKYLSKEQVISLIPDRKKDIELLHKMGWERDDKFTWLPYQRKANGLDLMAYNEMYVPSWKMVPTLVDMETGEYTEIEADKEMINEFLAQYPQLKMIERPKKQIEFHVIVNDQLLKSEINPYGLDEYPFVPFLTIFEPESDQWSLKIQSLARCMIDPQRESNRRRSQMIDLLDSQINSGWIADENSVVNPRSLFQSSQGKVIWRKEDAKPGSLEKIPPAQIPPSMFQLQELFDRDMVEIAGINEAAFGAPESGNESGVMMMLRQGAAVVNIQDIFDNLRDSQKQISKKILKLIRTWTPSKIQRILGQQPSPEIFKEDTGKYDIAVQEGMLTDTQRQMYFRQLVDLKQMGVPVTGEMLAKAAPIQGKTEYIQQLAQMEQQQAQAQQQQMQIQQQLIDSQRQAQQAKAISDISLATERKSRAHSNLALSTERISESEQNRAQAALDRAKTITEIATMQTDRLLRVMDFVRVLEAEEIVDREAIGRKVQGQADQIEQEAFQEAQVKDSSISGLNSGLMEQNMEGQQ